MYTPKPIRAVLVFWIFFLCTAPLSALSAADRPPAAGSDNTMLSRYYQWLEKGEKALPEVQKALKSDKWRKRTHALLALGKLGDPSHVSTVVNAVKTDEHPAVKNCAVIALGDLQAESAVSLLLKLLDADRSAGRVLPKKRLIIQSLGKIGDSRAVKPLCKNLLAERGKQIRTEIAEALIRIGDPAASRILIGAEQNRGFPYIQAAEIIGEMPAKDAEAFLRPLLDNPRSPVKNAAAVALSRVGTEKSLPMILDRFADADQHLQENIAEALVAIDSEKAVAPLCKHLTDEKQTAMAAANALSRMTADTIAPKVYSKMKANPEINGPAAYILGRKKYGPAADTLRSRLRQADQAGQDQMAEALGRIGDRKSIDLLIKVAQRDNRQGSAGAIWALGHLKVQKAVPVLLEVLETRDRRLTAPAIFALGEIGDRAAAKPLIDLYYESGMRYQLQIGLALSNIGGPDVMDFIRTNIESSSEKRQKMAAYVMLKTENKAIIDQAIQLLDHPSKTIRRYAKGALKNNTGLPYDTVEQWRKWVEENQ
ncbi:MAG: HEAT repeat domain-containing protein [Thermodesulfobacteriota bacterium]